MHAPNGVPDCLFVAYPADLASQCGRVSDELTIERRFRHTCLSTMPLRTEHRWSYPVSLRQSAASTIFPG